MDATEGKKVSPEFIAIGAAGLLILGLVLSKSSGSTGTKTTVIQPSSAALNAASANYAASLANTLQAKQLDYQHQENVLNIGVGREKNQLDNTVQNNAISAQVTLGQQKAMTDQQQIAAQQSHDQLGFFGTLIGGVLGIFGI